MDDGIGNEVESREHTLLTGALILSASSVISKTLIPGAIFPIGVVTSLIGVPFFISLILSGKKNSW